MRSVLRTLEDVQSARYHSGIEKSLKLMLTERQFAGPQRLISYKQITLHNQYSSPLKVKQILPFAVVPAIKDVAGGHRMPFPSLDFLLDASAKSLADLELSSLNRAANLSKSLKREMDAWIEESASAMLARWMIENRAELLRQTAATLLPDKVELFEPGPKSIQPRRKERSA